MSIHFLCPFGHRLVVPENRAGKKGRCPVCHQRVFVPEPNPTPSGKPKRDSDDVSEPSIEADTSRQGPGFSNSGADRPPSSGPLIDDRPGEYKLGVNYQSKAVEPSQYIPSGYDPEQYDAGIPFESIPSTNPPRNS